MTVKDENGTWEVTEGIGCINRCLVEPSAVYIATHPEEFATPIPTIEEQVAIMAESIVEQQDSIDSQMDALRIIMTETIPSLEA